MPRKTAAAVMLTPDEAHAIYKLYATCVVSDRTYRSCQAGAFRNMVSKTAKARSVKEAFESLAARLERLAGQEAEKGTEAAEDVPAKEEAEERV